MLSDRIVIPLGVTPATLKNFTLYDMLGLAGELGASAGVEVRVIYPSICFIQLAFDITVDVLIFC